MSGVACRLALSGARLPFFPPPVKLTRRDYQPLRRDVRLRPGGDTPRPRLTRAAGTLGELRCVSRLKRSCPFAQIAQRKTSILSPKHPTEHPPCATRPKHLPPPNHRAISHIYLAPTGQRKLHAQPSTHLQQRPRRAGLRYRGQTGPATNQGHPGPA